MSEMSKQPLRVTESGQIQWADGTKLTETGSFEIGPTPAIYGTGTFSASCSKCAAGVGESETLGVEALLEALRPEIPGITADDVAEFWIGRHSEPDLTLTIRDLARALSKVRTDAMDNYHEKPRSEI